ncbi:MAG: amidase family protein, partial [Clostridia bacterium]
MNLCTLKAWQAAQLLADGSITARELTKAYTTQNDSFNAFITRTSEFALRTAEHVDKLRAAHEKLPPLAGVPIAVKDNICVKGYPCTCASKMLAHFKPPYDATAAVRIKSNLMPILGKTNM